MYTKNINELIFIHPYTRLTITDYDILGEKGMFDIIYPFFNIGVSKSFILFFSNFVSFGLKTGNFPV